MRPYDHADTYRAAGWTGTLPLPAAAKSTPPAGFTGHDGRWPTADDLDRWRVHGYPMLDQETRQLVHVDAGNLALRLPPVVVGLDVDHYDGKTGGQAFTDLADKLGPPPPTWRSTSRDDGISGIRLYRVPAALDWPSQAGADIEVIRHGHRYAVVAPSVHPEGRTYRWVHDDGRTTAEPPRPGDLPELPAEWVAYLTGTDPTTGRVNGTRPGTRAHQREELAPARAWLRQLDRGDPCAYVGRLVADALAAARREDGNAYDTTRDAVLALLRAGERGHPGAGTMLGEIRGTYVATVAGKRPRAVAEGEFDKFTEGGAGKVLAEPTPDEDRGCRCGAEPFADLLPPRDTPREAPSVTTPDGQVGATWRPIDLAPYLSGQAVRPLPTVGMARMDGLRLMYPGKEHTVIGEMESGKSWYAIGSVAAEITTGHRVVYIHFEETDPTDTVERLQALDVPDQVILDRFRFVGPSEPVDQFVLAAVLDPAPSLVVLDGVNEAMSLHSMGIRDEDGAAAFRRRLVKPCTAVGAAVLGADHVVKDRERRDRGPLGSIHKGNGLNGSLLLLENREPFGRGQRGASHVYVTKDRPGHLRRHGRPDKLAGKTYVGTLIVDDTRTKVPYTEVVLTTPPDQPDTEHAITADQADEAAVMDAVDLITKKNEGGDGVNLRTIRAVVEGIGRGASTTRWSGWSWTGGYWNGAGRGTLACSVYLIRAVPRECGGRGAS